MKRIVRFTVSLLLFGFLVFPAQAFTSLWIFGDTVSTTTANDNPFPFSPTNYFGQRFCNGPVWVELLAQLQGLSYDSNKNTSYYALDSTELLNNILPYFTAPGDANTALFVVWVDDADMLDDYSYYTTNLSQWTAAINQAQTNHLRAITNLYSKGVRTLVMPTAVDISKIPQYRLLQASTLAFLRQRCIDFNTGFVTTLNQARASCPGLTIYSPDFFTLLDNILASPASYGVVNALYQGKTIDALDDPNLADKSLNGPGASYLWWDMRDPTAKLQTLMANFTQYMLSPSPSRINSFAVLTSNNRLDVSNIPVGRDGIVQSSTDFVNWTTVQSIVNSANTNQTIYVPTSASPYLFYRLRF